MYPVRFRTVLGVIFLPLLLLLGILLPSPVAQAEPTLVLPHSRMEPLQEDAADDASVATLKSSIDAAEQAFKDADFAQSATRFNQAVQTLESLLAATAKDDVAEIRAQHKRLLVAQRLLKKQQQTVSALPRLKFNFVTPKPGGEMADTPRVSFTQQVAPVLAQHCGRCHISRRSGDVSLASISQMVQLISAGDSQASQLYAVIADESMPKGNNKLSAAEKAVVKTWIDQGAKLDGGQLDFDLRPLLTMAPPPAAPSTDFAKAEAGDTVFFSKDIAPLLATSCSGCHIDAGQNRAGLSLDSFAAMMRGGDSGPAIVPGNPEQSLLVQKLKGMGDGQRMPLNRPVWEDAQITLISTWIREGAHFDAADANAPTTSLARLSALAGMDAVELDAHRGKLAIDQWQLALVGQEYRETTSAHFRAVAGYGVGSGRMDSVLLEMEKVYAKFSGQLPTSDASFSQSKITVFLPNSLYDFSEFAKMVEKREADLNERARWGQTLDGPYILAVATLNQEQWDAQMPGLVAPAMVANLAPGLPTWFCNSVAMSVQDLPKSQVDQVRTAFMTNPPSEANIKSWTEAKLAPQAQLALDLLAGQAWRRLKGQLKGIVAAVNQGQSLDQAIEAETKTPAPAFVLQLLQTGMR